jgi:isopenicillin N synthase-like dioxygenase
MNNPVRPVASDLVPVIDLSRFGNPADRRAISQEIRAACASTGFFLVKGHGIATEICAGVIAASKRYFALPEEERLT